MSKQNYDVFISQVITRKFPAIEANSENEAAIIAEGWVADGEPGEITDVEWMETDVTVASEEES